MEYKIRTALAKDAEMLAEIRIRQLLDEGSQMKYDVRAEMVDFFERKIKEGTLVQYIAEYEGKLISTAAVLYQEYPPSISWRGSHRGYVTNVYTVPAYRRQGIATELLHKVIEDARSRKLGNLWLLASKEGRNVYKKLGFDDERSGLDTYMEWFED